MRVVLLMGSDSDWPQVEKTWQLLKEFGVNVAAKVLSAHRTPTECAQFVQAAEGSGVKVFIAAAGLAAHLPGTVAAHTGRPVIGLPLAVGPLSGQDALYSMAQMPPGVPVATVAIDGAVNAALLAVAILALSEPRLATALEEFRRRQRAAVLAKDKELQIRLSKQ